MYLGEIDNSLKLLEEIKTHYGADIITFSSILKGLLTHGEIQKGFKILLEAFEKFKPKETQEMLNYFLEKHSSKELAKQGVEYFNIALKKGFMINPKTFGIMTKIYGFAG